MAFKKISSFSSQLHKLQQKYSRVEQFLQNRLASHFALAHPELSFVKFVKRFQFPPKKEASRLVMADPLVDEVAGAAWNGERAKLASRLSNPQVIKLINNPSSRGTTSNDID